MEEARRAKSARSTDIDRGEFEQRSLVTLHEYLIEWIERYQGTGRRGFREETRNEYRSLLHLHTLRYFPERTKLSEVSPSMIAGFVAWLCDPTKQGRELADSTVRNALKPMRAALATARREGLIRHNPVSEVALPHRARIDEDEDRARPFPRIEDENGETIETMELVVSLVHPDHRLMFELLAATGLRRSELFALDGRHLALDGDRPQVKVRQRVRRLKGKGLVVGPLKSRYARRDLLLPLPLADRLRARQTVPDAPVFTSMVGTRMDPDNVAERVLAPACAEAGVEWAGFHTFRHTVASRLFAAGRNAVQVQRWLGHHSAAFTLATYVHLLDDDLGDPLLPHVQSANKVQTGPTPLDAIPELAGI